jgi:hypothetical protein
VLPCFAELPDFLIAFIIAIPGSERCSADGRCSEIGLHTTSVNNEVNPGSNALADRANMRWIPELVCATRFIG